MPEKHRCYHCNNPVPHHVDLTIQVEDTTFPVCCTGCQAVARLVLNGGFDQFYKFRSASLSIPNPLLADDEELLSLFDRPDVLKKMAHPLTTTGQSTSDDNAVHDDSSEDANGSSTWRIELAIDGITCAACVWLIEQFVKQLAGVNEFWVNLTTHRAELVWQQSVTPLSQIFKTIQKLGFKAAPFSAGEEERRLQAQQKATLVRLGVAGIGMMQNLMFAAPMYFGIVVDADQFTGFFRYVSLLVACPVVLYSARPFFIAALRDLRVRHLTMDVPVAIAIGSAFAASAWVTIIGGEDVYFDSVCMFTFFLLLGRYLESSARAGGARSSARLRAMNQAFIRRIDPENHQASQMIPCEDLMSGDLIELRPGSLIPADGQIISGTTAVNEAALTGEFAPQPRQPGDAVLSGSVNIDNKILVKITAIGEKSHLSTINRLVDRALQERPKLSALADRVASYFVAGVLIIATIVALSWWHIDPDRAFSVTLAVLVVTCPCALSLATPTALTVATTALREAGFIITRGQVLETLAKINHFVFDKTGTLTQGELSIQHIENHSHCLEELFEKSLLEEELKVFAAALEWDSPHPIAKVFRPFARQPAQAIKHLSGFGVEGHINNKLCRLGRRDFVLYNKTRQARVDSENTADYKNNAYAADNSLQQVYLSCEGQLLAVFHLSDVLRPSATEMAAHLAAQNKKTSILSGDTSAMVAYTAKRLGIGRFFNGLSPQQKLAQVKTWQQSGDSVAMIGDGINDVPVMAGAHLSVAMNNASDLTQLKADAIILNGDLKTLSFACDKAQSTYRIIRQNIFWAIGYNLTALPLAALGFVPPYAAAIGMSASSLLVVLNAMRLRQVPKKELVENTGPLADTKNTVSDPQTI